MKVGFFLTISGKVRDATPGRRRSKYVIGRVYPARNPRVFFDVFLIGIIGI